MVVSRAEGTAGGAGAAQSDYDKIRRTPFLYGFNVINTAALLCTVGTPLALYAAELGIDKGKIGILGGLLPFAQTFCILFLPVVMQYSQRIVTVSGYGLRHLFLLSWLAAPMLASPDQAFWLLFASMSAFSLFRTLAETAIWPWSQEYLPRQVRGRVAGINSLAALPVVLGGSLLIQLWLDSRAGIERFFPLFVVGIVLGMVSVLMLLGLRGGRPRPDSPRGLDAIRAMKAPIADRGFWLYLYSSGTQYFAYTATGLFLVLFLRERLGMSSGELVTLAAFGAIGGALGGLVTGWLVDRYGTRAIRIVLQGLQVVLLISLLLVNETAPFHEVLGATLFFLMGLLFQSSLAVGGIYLLNFVPPSQKENYMTLAYATDGIIGGGATFLAGLLVQVLQDHPLTVLGTPIDSFAFLFILCAVVVVTSAAAFGMLREEGATGVRTFLGYFGHGSVVRALLTIPQYGALTSEERRRELAYGFGGTRSALVTEELIAALSDPSFDVRHEAILSLGHLPPSPAVTRALEAMLARQGLAELQYAALGSLGRLGATESAGHVAAFLDHPSPMLRARAIRTLGDLNDERYLPRIRAILADDPELDCRLAAVSSLGKFRDEASIEVLAATYRTLAQDELDMPGEPRSKVVLLALAKILGIERSFSREWRLEQRQPGARLPGLAERLAGTVRRMSARNAQLLAKRLHLAAEGLGTGGTREGFAALRDLRPLVAASARPEARLVLAALDGTREIAQPDRALVILVALAIRRALAPRADGGR